MNTTDRLAPPELLTIAQTAVVLGVSHQSVYRWIWQGQIPTGAVIDLGRHRRIKLGFVQLVLDMGLEMAALRWV